MRYPKPQDEIKDLESALSWIDELEGVIGDLEDSVTRLSSELDLVQKMHRAYSTIND